MRSTAQARVIAVAVARPAWRSVLPHQWPTSQTAITKGADGKVAAALLANNTEVSAWSSKMRSLAFGAMAGFLAGFGWAAMGIGIVSLFERRSLSYVLINGGYLTVALTVMGVILGGWR